MQQYHKVIKQIPLFLTTYEEEVWVDAVTGKEVKPTTLNMELKLVLNIQLQDVEVAKKTLAEEFNKLYWPEQFINYSFLCTTIKRMLYLYTEDLKTLGIRSVSDGIGNPEVWSISYFRNGPWEQLKFSPKHIEIQYSKEDNHDG